MIGNDYEELNRVDQLFRENGKDILQGMTEVLENRGGIRGYNVTHVTFTKEPTPEFGIPYCTWTPDSDGLRCGIFCVSETLKEVITKDLKVCAQIDQLFRDNSKEILEGMTEVLECKGIEGYHVTHVTFAPASQEKIARRICLFLCYWIPKDGFKCGWFCF
jgi:hypothetical protein